MAPVSASEPYEADMRYVPAIVEQQQVAGRDGKAEFLGKGIQRL
jgi:hypothetical protein